MKEVDPFSAEADPGREEEASLRSRMARRSVLVSLVVLPAVTAACTSLAPACPTQPASGVCSHRFCRYHRG